MWLISGLLAIIFAFLNIFYFSKGKDPNFLDFYPWP